MTKAILILALSALPYVHAGIRARMPQVTPAPQLPRRQDSGTTSSATLGWTSVTEFLSSTSWRAFTYDSDEYYFTSSDSYFGDCEYSATTTCDPFTACDGYYITDAETSYSLGTSYYCGTDTLYTSKGATESLIWVWVVSTTVTDASEVTYYFNSPPATAESTTSTESSDSTSTSSSSSSSTTVPTTPTPTPAPHKSNVGIIAGAAVGGVAVLGAVVLGVVFLLRRSKNKRNTGAEGGAYQPPPDQTYPPPSAAPMSPAPTTATPLSPAPPYGTPAYGYGYDQKQSGVNVNAYEQPGYNNSTVTYAAPHHAAPQDMQQIPEMGGTEVPRGVGGPNTPGPNPATPGPNAQVSELPTAR